MNLKYFEYIVIYLSVLVVCVVVGALARISFIGKGGDEYTANIVFWSITALSILFYAIIILFLDVIIVGFRKIFRKKNNSTNSTVDFIPTKNHENITIAQRKIIDDNTANQLIEDSKENIEEQTMERINLESIRKTQLQQKQQIESEKLQVAVDYTRNQFALYLKDEDLDSLCDAVNLYSVKEDIHNNISIYTKDLTNLDLYHFGWNIWNHFRPIKQEEVSKLLKNVFVSLDDIDLESIKSHLKDEPKRGIIKIQENLTDYQKI
ncbi:MULTISPECIES: hypothetical protein [unclassified Kaistella]|uniref:hypothetical protein n=1 Tax=unclassified Kaistella TaxID=2762626 RepID=UPI0027368652|nr:MULTISPECIES: hypothetical protein [unclassified Kaistella]MDP2454164.1 hypothetical protein [Kaistella sp. SH11-4b]MDP2457765.1 hypothetical protein [Kaistella sp. SH40-3]MDP2460523.1 hypothetical protein [Kaistella sp. SH19-2b]